MLHMFYTTPSAQAGKRRALRRPPLDSLLRDLAAWTSLPVDFLPGSDLHCVFSVSRPATMIPGRLPTSLDGTARPLSRQQGKSCCVCIY